MEKKPHFTQFEGMPQQEQQTQGRNGHSYPGLEEPSEEANMELTDAIDHEILMHRDAHFGGDFTVMLNYYEEEGVGADPDYDLQRIAYLKEVEDQLGGDLAALVLNAAEAERVAESRRAYENLKDVYASEDEVAKLIADLILTEDEDPILLIDEIVDMGEKMAPGLLELVQSPFAYDPLAPGYGYAPSFAIECLGKLRYENAIVPIFEKFGQEMVFDEEILLEALHNIGEGAKRFLVQIVQSRPITSDNIHAAFALTAFANDTDIATLAYEQLQEEEVRAKPLFSTYLLCQCDALQGTVHKEAFIAMSKDPSISANIRGEIENIVRDWH